MKKTILQMLLTLTIAAAFSACSVKSSTDADIPAPTPVVFENKIEGPKVEGTWTSACLYDSYSGRYAVKSATFAINKINRVVSLYSDYECTQLFSKEDLKGLFRWAEMTSYKGYVIDYRLNLDNGWTQTTQEELLIENNSMYLSDFRVGFGSISKVFAMKKQITINEEGN